MEYQEATVFNIGSESLIPDLFQQELNKVIENLEDPNTLATAKRKITIEVELSATCDEREDIQISISAKSKLAPHTARKAQLFLQKGLKKSKVLTRGPAPMDDHVENVTKINS